MIRRALTCAGLVLLSGSMIIVGISAWLGIDRIAAVDDPADAFQTARTWQPWGGPAWSPAAELTLPELATPEARDDLLRQLVSRYPLESRQWLERARAARSLGEDTARLLDLVTVATAIQPYHAENHWRAAMLTLEWGEQGIAETHLRRFVELNPAGADRAAAVARRWHAEPVDLLAALIPPGAAEQSLLRAALRWQDWPLAAAIWDRLPATVRQDESLASIYVDGLVRDGHTATAVRVWREVAPEFDLGVISNGDFSAPLRQRVLFDWRLSAPDGVRIERTEDDHVSPPASLRIRFDGEHNPNLRSPTQHVAVQADTEYRLTGHWRGQGLTTRSLPAVYVINAGNNRRLAQLEAPAGDWPWQPFELAFTTAEDTDRIYIQVRRGRSRDLDRWIAGDLYLDDLSLQAQGPVTAGEDT